MRRRLTTEKSQNLKGNWCEWERISNHKVQICFSSVLTIDTALCVSLYVNLEFDYEKLIMNKQI